ncbi:F-box protein PP2-A13-like [Cynara cardunculus var. scolymus]|uniref:F-box domain, cyclin-like protein n=1 Tax=Cynara cardunculus var. scolymus TaxID=59895 RepID=A0A118JUX4_CYNCS|nr:F-box protein PP2-A13-like [Cynara cardunculus var. scolymus]KVH91887.1 F-box domain, cyclin-like protein [Cynara cardunculus var. scolymus]
MGSGFSSLLLMCNSTTTAPMVSSEPSLGDLPESVLGSVLVYLNPQEICRLAALNRAFRCASSAEFVWESKLPKNYDLLISRVFDSNRFSSNLCKKEIYARLSRPNPIDGGTKKVWLDKGTGKACVLISSNGLAITGIDDRRYWSWISTEESRFLSVAYLQQIWWFEVDGEVEFPFPSGTYSLYFRLQLGRSSKRFGRRVCNSDHVHGWDIKPVKFQLSTSDGQKAITQCYLSEPGKWNLYRAGDFVIEDSKVPMKIKFSMTQIDCTHTKGGLCVDSVLICPK